MTLLEALREDLGIKAVKDGCSPQGQCGCCTVLVDGAPRVACVTPVRRVAGRDVRTVDGLESAVRARLVDAFLASGGSQCGFCTPGILCRLAALGEDPDPSRVRTALLAHLCRCTGWQPIVDAVGTGPLDAVSAGRRATLEGGVPQLVGPDVVLGRAGFSDDTAPEGCLVAVPDGAGGWALGETLDAAREAAGKVQGRRSGAPLDWPVEIPAAPEGQEWDLSLQTTWIEPAYLEPDSSWCEPGGEPSSPVANGGAFGGKQESPAPAAARALADRHGRPVRVVLSREDVVRFGPKRPPAGGGVMLDGTGVLRLAAPAASLVLEPVAPGIEVEWAPLPSGLPVSMAVRAAGWAEAAVLSAAARAAAAGVTTVTVPGRSGGSAEATVRVDPADGWPVQVEVAVDAGDPLSEVTLRSYITGAAHMALGWVLTEGIAVGPEGPVDLTIRSFGVLRAVDMPAVEVDLRPPGDRPPVPVSDAVFAAVAAAAWLSQGLPSRWPTHRGGRR